MSRDDLIRRECNFSLQCNQILDIKKIEQNYNIVFKDYFKNEINKINLLVKKGFLVFDKDKIKVTTLGRYFVRHICQVFDTFINEETDYKVHGN